ncbi:MAG: hypothetical protein QXV64_02150 [Candidatus Anstonellaceae archaeon]
MGDRENYIKSQLYGSIASRYSKSTSSSRGVNISKSITAPKAGRIRHGKKVVFVTPYLNSAKEEEKKWMDKGYKTEIKKEKDENGKVVFVVYVFE